MSNKKIDLTGEDFSFLCPMKQSDMTAVDGGYFCDKCEEKVHDVSDMTETEFNTLVDKTEDICVSFKKSITMTMALSIAASATISHKIKMGKVKIRDKNTTKIHTNGLLNQDINASKKENTKIEQSSCQTYKK